jgi:hypothetical protein
MLRVAGAGAVFAMGSLESKHRPSQSSTPLSHTSMPGSVARALRAHARHDEHLDQDDLGPEP